MGSNLEDINEAGNPNTPCDRQVELAGHPSLLVKTSLASNPNLCSEAAEILGGLVPKLRGDVRTEAQRAISVGGILLPEV